MLKLLTFIFCVCVCTWNLTFEIFWNWTKYFHYNFIKTSVDFVLFSFYHGTPFPLSFTPFINANTKNALKSCYNARIEGKGCGSGRLVVGELVTFRYVTFLAHKYKKYQSEREREICIANPTFDVWQQLALHFGRNCQVPRYSRTCQSIFRYLSIQQSGTGDRSDGEREVYSLNGKPLIWGVLNKGTSA